MEIRDYQQKWKQAFADLNLQWLEEYFYVEDYDREVLLNPEEYILSKGGHILFAVETEKVLGTVALIKRGEGVFELSKMAVDPASRGKGIGKDLMTAAINWTKNQKAHTLMLDSNRKLTPAIALYVKSGFVEIPVDPNTPYERCNIRMEMKL